MVKIGIGRGKAWTLLDWSLTKEGALAKIPKLEKSAKVKYIQDEVTYQNFWGWGIFGIGEHVSVRDKKRRAKSGKLKAGDRRRR